MRYSVTTDETCGNLRDADSVVNRDACVKSPQSGHVGVQRLTSCVHVPAQGPVEVPGLVLHEAARVGPSSDVRTWLFSGTEDQFRFEAVCRGPRYFLRSAQIGLDKDDLARPLSR